MPNYLYILTITKDMPGMGRGKSVAHAAHAANLFTFNHYVKHVSKDNPPSDDVVAWHEEGEGFGTTIALDVGTKDQLLDVINECLGLGALAAPVVDPTYPYLVDAELVRLIEMRHHSIEPTRLDNGMYLCHRSEITSGYVFGDKEKLAEVLGKYGLLSNDTISRTR